MGTGQVISDTFGMVKERFGQLLGLWAIYFVITIVLSIALVVGMGTAGIAGLAAAESNPLAIGGGMILVIVLFYIGYLLLSMAQYASMILMASPIARPTIGDALGAGWRAAPALLLLMIVLIIAYIPVSLVLALVAGALAATLSTIGEFGGVLVALLLVPVLVWLGCRLSLLFAVVAVDGVRNPFKVIARSWTLTKGHALTIFLASLVFIVILAVIAGVALLPSIGLLRTMADPAALTGATAAPAVGGILLFGLGFLVVSVLFTMSYCAFQAVIHGSLTGAAGEAVADAFA